MGPRRDSLRRNSYVTLPHRLLARGCLDIGIAGHDFHAFLQNPVCDHLVSRIKNFSGDRDLWLDLLMSHLIEPQLAGPQLVFVYDYPASQAALARIATVDGVQVGQRFELYVDGMELANGYFELTDPEQQRQRFEQDNQRRLQLGLSPQPLDELLLAAMAHGLPASLPDFHLALDHPARCD